MTPALTPITRRTAVGSALALALAACSGRGADQADPAAKDPTGTVTLGLLPVVEVAPVYLGIKRRVFADRGIDVTVKQFQGGAFVIPALIAGEVQFGFSNVVSLLSARDKGVPLVSVAGGGSSTGDPAKDINAVMVAKGSTLKRAKDLVGRKVAINSWNNLGDTTVKTAVRKDGGDDWGVQFVRMPFPEMPARLAKGEVDAAWVAEPFRSAILGAGGRVLFDNLTETYPRVQPAQYFTSEQLLQRRPALVAAFAEAAEQSMAYAVDHPDEVRGILGTYTKIPAAAAKAIVLPVWSPKVDADSTRALGEAAHRFGTLTAPPDVDGLLRIP